MKLTETELFLNREGVDAASQEMADWLAELGVPRRDALRIRLTMEELLLRICEHYGEGVDGTLRMGKYFGIPFISFRYAGEAYDPIHEQSDELDGWTEKLLANMGLSPSWSCRFGRNQLIQTIDAPKKISQAMLPIAFILAVLLGLAGTALPEAVRDTVSQFVLTPISDVFTRLLNTFVGPMVFLSIVTGICGIGTAAEFSRIGKQMLTRYLSFSFLGSAMAVMTLPLFSLPGTSSSGAAQSGRILELLLNILPSNPIQPFSDGNTLQIIFLAVFLGVILLGMGERSTRIKELFQDFHGLVMQAVSAVCKLLPLFIFSSFTLQIWSSGIDTIIGLWKPIVISVALCTAFLLLKMVFVCTRLKVRAPVLMRKIFPGMLVGFTTASGSTAYSLCAEVNAKQLGIASHLTRIGYPIGSQMYNVCLSTLFVLTAYTAAEAFGVGGGADWIVMLWIVSTIVSFAVPPVSGGSLACIGVLLSQLGIPGQALGLAGALGLILDFVVTGFGLGMRHMELVLQANKLGMLDRDVLRRQ
ncbi:MAG: cation:dicarboxylase symporter family transporter [Firmicutes bacterium]|nr:cation:dicarboxylase symporter family transporter [Bacillota bacterium]